MLFEVVHNGVPDPEDDGQPEALTPQFVAEQFTKFMFLNTSNILNPTDFTHFGPATTVEAADEIPWLPEENQDQLAVVDVEPRMYLSGEQTLPNLVSELLGLEDPYFMDRVIESFLTRHPNLGRMVGNEERARLTQLFTPDQILRLRLEACLRPTTVGIESILANLYPAESLEELRAAHIAFNQRIIDAATAESQDLTTFFRTHNLENISMSQHILFSSENIDQQIHFGLSFPPNSAMRKKDEFGKVPGEVMVSELSKPVNRITVKSREQNQVLMEDFLTNPQFEALLEHEIGMEIIAHQQYVVAKAAEIFFDVARQKARKCRREIEKANIFLVKLVFRHVLTYAKTHAQCEVIFSQLFDQEFFADSAHQDEVAFLTDMTQTIPDRNRDRYSYVTSSFSELRFRYDQRDKSLFVVFPPANPESEDVNLNQPTYVWIKLETHQKSSKLLFRSSHDFAPDETGGTQPRWYSYENRKMVPPRAIELIMQFFDYLNIREPAPTLDVAAWQRGIKNEKTALQQCADLASLFQRINWLPRKYDISNDRIETLTHFLFLGEGADQHLTPQFFWSLLYGNLQEKDAVWDNTQQVKRIKEDIEIDGESEMFSFFPQPGILFNVN